MEFFTIGVFNTNDEQFFNKLIQNDIDTFCDIRQRRAVRGSKYAFVNSQRLQDKLNQLGVKYVYVKDLAPTIEIRSIQKAADKENNELKSQRQELGNIFIKEYQDQILRNFNFKNFITDLEKIGAKRIALFCVEEKAKACHRSLVADKLLHLYSLKSITDL